MTKSTVFVFDRAKLPEVVSKDSDFDSIYVAGDWSFEKNTDTLEEAEMAIYSWIAWYEFLKNNK